MTLTKFDLIDRTYQMTDLKKALLPHIQILPS